MNDVENVILDNDMAVEESFDFEELEEKLTNNLNEELSDLQFLKEDREMIGNPDGLGSTVLNVVWEQFVNQIGAVAGEDFIKDNRELLNHGEKTERGASLSEDDIKAYHLDLRKEAHIQTTENFAEGKIATHNYISREQLEQNYDRFKNTPHKQFRDEYVDPQMNATLKRAGQLKKEGIDTVTDIYTGRQIPTETKLADGKNNPKAAQREHVKASADLYKDPSLQMANGNEELASIINNPENLQGYTTAERNNRKSDKTSNELDEKDKTKHWEKANKRAEEFVEKKKKEGEERLKAEGRKTQKEEAFRIGGKALHAAVMGLLASLIKTIVQKFIAWLRSKDKRFNTFIEQLKEAIKTFISNLKQNVLTAGNTVGTTILAAIFGPIVSTIKKAWIFLKQGAKSLKEAIDYVKNPENRNKSVSILLIEVGKIVMAGVTAAGAIVLGDVIEKGLSTIPGFGVDIPLIGSLANILGIFLGALVSGLIGALALNLMDRAIASIEKRNNTRQQIEKGNDILGTQAELIKVKTDKLAYTEEKVANAVREHHEVAEEIIRDAVNDMTKMNKQSENTKDEIDRLLITLQEN